MSIKTVVECDGNGCDTNMTFSLDCWEYGDLPTIEWRYDSDNQFYYCPSCVKKLIASGELKDV